MHRGTPRTRATRQPTGHRVLSLACPGFLTVPQGGMSGPPAVRKAAEFLRRETLRYLLCATCLAGTSGNRMRDEGNSYPGSPAEVETNVTKRYFPPSTR